MKTVEPLVDSEEQVGQIVGVLRTWIPPFNQTLDQLVGALRHVIDTAAENHVENVAPFFSIGNFIVQHNDRKGEWETAFRTLLYHKHKLYGPVAITKWSYVGVLIRIDSKLARVENMIQRGESGDGVGESISDTISDILGYSVLAIAMSKRSKA